MILSRRSILATLPSAMLAAEGRRIHAAVIVQPGVNFASYFKRLGTNPQLDRIALCDETGGQFDEARQLLGARASDLRTYKNVSTMLREIQPALVVVGREAARAPEAVQAALEANAHVIVEKPGCTSLRQFDRLAALAESRQRQVMIALATRLNPAARKAREILRAGTLGKPFGASMYWIGDQTRLKNPAYHKSWYASRSRAGGGKLLLHGLHYIDLIAFFTGDNISKVTAICANVGGQPIEVEDAAAVAMEFSSGWNATLNAGYYLDKGFANLVQVWCAKGWLRFDPGAKQPLEWQVSGGPVQSFTAPEQDHYALMFDSAVRLCMGQEPPFVTTRECRAALNTVFSAYRAAETGTAQSVA